MYFKDNYNCLSPLSVQLEKFSVRAIPNVMPEIFLDYPDIKHSPSCDGCLCDSCHATATWQLITY